MSKHNLKYFENKPHFLFVCSKNKWRSPTAVQIFRHDDRISVRSAGVKNGSNHLISEEDIIWADLIFVMEHNQKNVLSQKFPSHKLPQIVSLDIPDDYEYMNEELIELITNGSEYHIELFLKKIENQ